MKSVRKLGFSLLELSVVLMTIGLLMVAIVKGSDLIAQARLASARELTLNSPVLKIDNLALWLETTMPASFLTAEVRNGGSISTWKNIGNPSPNVSFDATQATLANQPVYRANAINDLPALEFVLANSTFMSVPSNFDGKTLNVTIFLVWQSTSTLSPEMDLLEKWAGSGPYPYVLRSTSGGYWFASYDGSNNPLVSSSVSRSYGITHLISASKIRSGTMQMWINGISQGTATDNTNGNNTNNIALNIGRRGNGSLYTSGYFAEVIIYSKVLVLNKDKMLRGI